VGERCTWGWLDLAASIPAVDALRIGRVGRIVRILRLAANCKSQPDARE
jgi:voltage-gated potassium channel